MEKGTWDLEELPFNITNTETILQHNRELDSITIKNCPLFLLKNIMQWYDLYNMLGDKDFHLAQAEMIRRIFDKVCRKKRKEEK